MSEQTARDITIAAQCFAKPTTSHLVLVPELVTVIADALAQARREEREACAKLVEVIELGSPSGRSAHEQRNLFEIMDKIALAIRQREGA